MDIKEFRKQIDALDDLCQKKKVSAQVKIILSEKSVSGQSCVNVLSVHQGLGQDEKQIRIDADEDLCLKGRGRTDGQAPIVKAKGALQCPRCGSKTQKDFLYCCRCGQRFLALKSEKIKTVLKDNSGDESMQQVILILIGIIVGAAMVMGLIYALNGNYYDGVHNKINRIMD